MNGIDIGMLWFDNDPKHTLLVKITGGITYYEDKYGRKPNFVKVHPSTLKSEKLVIPGVSIESHRSVMPNHFLIGVRDVQ